MVPVHAETWIAGEKSNRAFSLAGRHLRPGFVVAAGTRKPEVALYRNAGALVDVRVGADVDVCVAHLVEDDGKLKSYVYRYTSGKGYLLSDGEPLVSPWHAGQFRIGTESDDAPPGAPNIRAKNSDDESGPGLREELLRRFSTVVHVAVYDTSHPEFKKRSAEWAGWEAAVGAAGTRITGDTLAIGSPVEAEHGLVRTLTDVTTAIASVTGADAGPTKIRTLAIFAHGWTDPPATVTIGNAGAVRDDR